MIIKTRTHKKYQIHDQKYQIHDYQNKDKLSVRRILIPLQKPKLGRDPQAAGRT